PGKDQTAARGRTAVRQAGGRRPGQHRRGGGRAPRGGLAGAGEAPAGHRVNGIVPETKKATFGSPFSFNDLRESLHAISDATLGEVVGGHFDLDLIAREDADVVLPHAPGDVGNDLVAVLELHPEHGVREGFGDRTLELDDVVFGHAVLSICSAGRHWAARKVAHSGTPLRIGQSTRFSVRDRRRADRRNARSTSRPLPGRPPAGPPAPGTRPAAAPPRPATPGGRSPPARRSAASPMRAAGGRGRPARPWIRRTRR